MRIVSMAIFAGTAIFILAFWRTAMAEEKTAASNDGPQVRIKYIYTYANDLDAMRVFYTELLGMKEGAFRNDEQWGWLTYDCGGFQLMFFRSEPPHGPVPVETRWAQQPGWNDGEVRDGAQIFSWSVLVPESAFAETVARLIAAGIETYFDKPQWFQDSYWGFPLRDPMGNTVEIYSETKERPASTEWPG